MCSSALSTEHERRVYFENNFSYVHPQTLNLGVNKNRKQCHVQYVPIKETLRAMLKDPVVWQECLRPDNVSLSTHILGDIYDGTEFKSNALFSESGNSQKLILYQDSFEVVNPLGSTKKKHKLLGVYYTLANFYPFHCSAVENLQLLLLCKESDFKYVGQDKVFSTMLSDLKELETKGLEICRHVVKASVFCRAGDNLGSHNIGGFFENFSTADYFCRYFLVTRNYLFEILCEGKEILYLHTA